MVAVKMKVKIGDVEFRIVPRPASIYCSAQAISVNGIALLMSDCVRKRRQFAPSRGIDTPRIFITVSRITAAMIVREAIMVIGGMV